MTIARNRIVKWPTSTYTVYTHTTLQKSFVNILVSKHNQQTITLWWGH